MDIDITTDDNDLTATIPTWRVEDDDDCLAAAIAIVAERDPGFAADLAAANWADDDRDEIVVTGWTRSPDTTEVSR